MTYQQMYASVRKMLQQAGLPSDYWFPPDEFLQSLWDTMQDFNEDEDNGAPIYICRDLSFATRVGERYVRLREGASGPYLTVVRLLRASYDGDPLLIENPLQHVGPKDSSADETTGSPTHIWIEEDHWAGTFSSPPVSQQVVGFNPLPDLAYTVHATCAMPTPTSMVSWSTEIPVRKKAHRVLARQIAADVLAASPVDAHKLQSLAYKREVVMALAQLREYAQQEWEISQPDHSSETFDQVE